MCCPKIHQYLESLDGSLKGQGHKEKTATFIAKFNKDCMKVYDNMLINPFSENTLFHKLNSAYVYPEVIAMDSEKVFTAGSKLYSDFRRERLIIGLYDLTKMTIKKVSLKSKSLAEQ